jgi:hypothetical protein
MIIAPTSVVASEETRASYVAIEYVGVPDKPIATIVLTTDAAYAASWKPTEKNKYIVFFVHAYLIDADVYAKVYDFLASEAAKRKGETLPLDDSDIVFEISGRTVSGKANNSDDGEDRNAFGWSLSDDIKTFAIPLNGKEYSEIMKVAAKYLDGQDIEKGLQRELDKWR